MAKKDSKKIKEAIVQYNKVIIAVFALMALFLLFNFYYTAEITNIQHEKTGKLCPDPVYPSFDLIFMNEGQMGTELCVEVMSEEVNFEKDKICKQIYPEEEMIFAFSPTENPEENEAVDSFEIKYKWDYRKNLIQPKTYTTTCKYER
ncbi:MAG: hypothetical protein R6U26_02330 [Candidatus Undinarchaeales archaeon]